MAVCSTWRTVAAQLGFAGLWSVAPIQPGCHHLEGASLALRRSQGPTSEKPLLHLAAMLWDGYYDPDTLFKGKAVPQLTQINIETRSECATTSVPGLVQKLLESPSLNSEMSIHQYHDPQEKPLLQPPEEHEFFDCYMSEEGRKAFTDLMMSLTALRLRNVNLQWDTIVFSDQLVDLHLQSVVLSEYFLLDELPDVLRSAPNLRSLKFISVVALPPTWNHPLPMEAVLPKLETLLLADLFENVSGYVLAAIAPGSHRTTLGLTHTGWSNLLCRLGADGELDPDAGWDEEGPDEYIARRVL